MAKSKIAESRFSYATEAQIDVGLWQGGEATVKDIGYCNYDYGGTLKAGRRGLPIVLLVIYQHAEGTYEQPYTIGEGWQLPEDKADLTATIIPTDGQTGFPKTCNAAYFFNSLRDAGYDLGEFDGDAGVKALVGQGLLMKREPQPDRGQMRDRGNRRDQGRDQDKEHTRERTFLLVRELLNSGPAIRATKAAIVVSKRPAKGPAKAARPVDADEDESPVRKPKGNGAATLEDEAKSALIEVLDHNDGQLALDDVEEKVFTHLRKHPQKKDIAELCADEDFLKSCEGVSYNAKKGIVALEA